MPERAKKRASSSNNSGGRRAMQYAIVWQKCYSLAPRKIWTVIWLNRNSVKLAETVGCSTGWGW